MDSGADWIGPLVERALSHFLHSPRQLVGERSDHDGLELAKGGNSLRFKNPAPKSAHIKEVRKKNFAP
jgi:hypothetical protein